MSRNSSWLNELKNKLRHLGHHSHFDESLADEIQSHIEMRADELVAGGMTRKEALSMARREFGSTGRLAEESRDAWRWNWLEDLARDLRYALRALRRDRSLALTAILSLALGIGVNTTIFSVATEFLFKPPSVRDADSMVHAEIGGYGSVGLREYRFLQDAVVFEGLAGYDENAEVNWRSGETSERLFGTRVSANFFDVTGMPVAFGRPIASKERDVVLVSHHFWKTSLNADVNVLGRVLILDGQQHTVVGVLPQGHQTLTGFAFAPDLYLPIESNSGNSARVALYGRLPDGATPQTIAAKLQSACVQLDQTYPDGEHKWATNIRVSRLTGIERLVQGNSGLQAFSAFFAMLMFVVSLLLMIACANVASLLLARAAGRAREFAVRLSIGASRGRLVRQLLAESSLLALLGTTAGLGLNLLLTNLLNNVVLPLPVPIRLAIRPDWHLLAYAAIVAVASALMAGLLPALAATRAATNEALKSGEHQVSGYKARLRNALVVGQLAVSVIVLVTAALFVRNLLRSTSMDPGFDLQNTTWAQVRPVPEINSAELKKLTLIRTSLDAIRALPGVESASFTQVVPLNDDETNNGSVAGDTRAESMQVRYFKFAVSSDYFKTMNIPILAGRDFEDSDRAGSPAVVIINESLAHRVFDSVSSVGHTMRFDTGPVTVVGVARNSKYFTLGEDDSAAIYEPYLQRGANRANLNFVVRSRIPPAALSKPLGRALLAIDPAAAVEVKPMTQATGFALLPSRAGACLLGVIGALGLTLASIGLYGVLSYSVSRRIGEIGLRIALGAQPGDVLKLVLREGAWMLGIGTAIGIFIAAFITRPLALFLIPGLKPSDPLTYVVVVAVLIAVGFLASVKPAFHALQADPATALRYE
jgi:putative ABC transport system permease protein